MKRVAVLAAAMAVAVPALAEDAEFKPETVGLKETIDPGPNVFVYQQEWKGAGSIAVYGKDDLAFKGLMTSGSMGTMLLAPGGKTAYTQSTYMKRITWGDIEQVLQVFDVATLTPVKEIALPPKAAMTLGYAPMLQQSADGKYVYVQNATPAASVTVVDPAAGTVLQEIPTPGCWGVYPTGEGYAFSMLCGDGSVSRFALGADGKTAEKTGSEKVFDPDADALFVSGVKVPDGWLFPSFGGNLYHVADGAAAPKLVEKFPVAEGVEGGWAPGSYGLAALDAKNGVLFLSMHPEAKEGSHKDLAKEVWAIDLATRKVLSRSPVEELATIAVDGADASVLVGLTEDYRVIRYTVDPKAGYALTKTVENKTTGFSMLATVTP